MKIIENKSFKDLTTFGVGGKIKYYAEVKNKKEVEEVFSFAKKNSLNTFIVGGGSNFLASDKEFNGLVVKFIGDKISINEDIVIGEAGAVWDDLVQESVAAGLSGLENLSGIPGTVGAAPVQNIGAYGSELSENFYRLEAFDVRKQKFVSFNKKECEFGYRSSYFKKGDNKQNYLIISVSLKLSKKSKSKIDYETLKGRVNENSSPLEVRNAVLAVRGERLENPKVHGNAGSFFMNPIINTKQKENLEKNYVDAKIFPFGEKFKTSAAWLIEKAGWKGKSFGGAAVSSKHALILINQEGKASFDDVYALSEKIIEDVSKKFGIKLEREVQLINF